MSDEPLVAAMELQVDEVMDRITQTVNCSRSHIFLALIDAGWDTHSRVVKAAQVSTALRVLLARFGMKPA